MTTLEAAIAERRERIAELSAELEQLEGAARLIAGVAASAPMKPPPPVRKERPVPVEEMPKTRKRGKRTDPFFQCGHERSGENLIEFGTKQICRTCKNAKQNARRAALTGKAPETKAEPEPVPVSPAPAPVNQVAIANASKWQRQCTMLDFETGRRCSLMTPHPMPHSASGRTFTTGLNPADLGGTSRPGRELDHHATSGSGL